MLDEGGQVLCNLHFLPVEMYESIDIETTTCPYCRLQWFRKNKDHIPNLPEEGDLLIHWDVRQDEEGVFALCGKILNDDRYHTCASREMNEITCDDCRRKMTPIAIDRLHRSLYKYSKMIRRMDVEAK